MAVRSPSEHELFLCTGDAEPCPAIEGADRPAGDFVEGASDFLRARLFVSRGSDPAPFGDDLDRARAVETDFPDQTHRRHSVLADLFGQMRPALAFRQKPVEPAQDREAFGCGFLQRQLFAEGQGSRARSVRLGIPERWTPVRCLLRHRADPFTVQVDVE